MQRFVRVLIVAAVLLAPRGIWSQPTPKLANGLAVLPHAMVTVLVDNMVTDGRLLGEWGLAVLIETGTRRVLFDTGGGRVIMENARALNVGLSKLDAIVISHGHDDHTGGLAKLFDVSGKVDLYLHPVAFGITYWKEDSRAVPRTMSPSREQLAARAGRLVETKGPALVTDGIMVTGGIPRVTDFEDTGLTTKAFVDKAMKTPDPITDDQALFFRTPEGVVVVLGCGHAGVVNTIRYISDLLGEPQIYAVIGGTHLLQASPHRIQKTADAFRQYGLKKIMLMHCTGVTAYSDLARAFPNRCTWPGAGARIDFGN